MKKITNFTIVFVLSCFCLHAQTDSLEMKETRAYFQIPEAPETYNGTNVVARMIDGLGYRYYWATEDLREADLEFTPGNNGRKASEVLDHLHGLSTTILNATLNKPNIRPTDQPKRSWDQLRKETLDNFMAASQNMRLADGEDLQHLNIVFQRGERTSEFPMWNLLNGPLADAISHVGQIVSYRRSAGNPVDPGVNVFMGVTKQ